jgi:hypothetical protein
MTPPLTKTRNVVERFSVASRTCKLNSIKPNAYLANTLRAIASEHKQSQIDDLLPWNFAV